MSEKKYFWLKLHDDFFTSKRIKKLRKLGSDFVIIYLKMQLLSLKNGGVIEFAGIEDDMAEEIALDIDEDVDKVQLTISFLQSCGLLEINDKNEFILPYVEKLTGASSTDEHTRESTRLRVQKHREKQKLLQGNDTVTDEKRYSNVTCNGEIDIEKDIDKEQEIRIRVRNQEREYEEKDEPTIRLSYLDDSAPVKRAYGETQNVLLSNEDFISLKEKFGLPTLIDYINRLSDYMTRNNKMYSNHADVISRWITRDQERKDG